MKTKEAVLEAIKAGRKSECLDGRDYARLLPFLPIEEWIALDFSTDPGDETIVMRPWTEEEFVKQLTEDLAFAFEKSLDKRSISASFMHSTVKQWMWILDDPLEQMEEYAQYGLPFLKAVAVKYNLPNPIGDDKGDEFKYMSDSDQERIKESK